MVAPSIRNMLSGCDPCSAVASGHASAFLILPHSTHPNVTGLGHALLRIVPRFTRQILSALDPGSALSRPPDAGFRLSNPVSCTLIKHDDPKRGHRVLFGVADRIRTCDRSDHNRELYQLSYSHHECGAIVADSVHTAIRDSTHESAKRRVRARLSFCASGVGCSGVTVEGS